MTKLKNTLHLIFLLTLILSCSTRFNDTNTEIAGKVISVIDGDTIEILFDGNPLKIRLAHIDCPEIKRSQPFSTAAKLYTSKLCFGQMVTVINEQQFDNYERLIAVIVNNKGQNVNKELVKAGLAWHFKKYSTDKDYAKLEENARRSRIGLWADENATPPWEWRWR